MACSATAAGLKIEGRTSARSKSALASAATCTRSRSARPASRRPPPPLSRPPPAVHQDRHRRAVELLHSGQIERQRSTRAVEHLGELARNGTPHAALEPKDGSLGTRLEPVA